VKTTKWMWKIWISYDPSSLQSLALILFDFAGHPLTFPQFVKQEIREPLPRRNKPVKEWDFAFAVLQAYERTETVVLQLEDVIRMVERFSTWRSRIGRILV